MTADHDLGFTLIETMAAMAILAVAAIGLVRVTEAHVDFIRRIETRSMALWVAENRLAELDLPEAAALPGTVRLLDHVWRATTRVTSTSDADLTAVEVTVGEITVGEVNVGEINGNHALVRLRSFKPSAAGR